MKLYNLDNADCDFLLNDCEGQSIRVVDVLIKEFTHVLNEPKVNEETGEIQEFETNKACILVDDAGNTYVTGSKLFTNQMKNGIIMDKKILKMAVAVMRDLSLTEISIKDGETEITMKRDNSSIPTAKSANTDNKNIENPFKNDKKWYPQEVVTNE